MYAPWAIKAGRYVIGSETHPISVLILFSCSSSCWGDASSMADGTGRVEGPGTWPKTKIFEESVYSETVCQLPVATRRRGS